MSDPTPPVLGQVPIPPQRSAAPSSSPTRPGIGCFVLPVVALLLIGGGIFFFLQSNDDGDSEPPVTGPSVAAPVVPVLAWTDAMEARNFESACDLMSTEAIAKLAINGASCDGELSRLASEGRYDEAGSTRVLDVVTKGDRALVTVQLGGGRQPEQTMVSVREGGTWKVAPFDGSLTAPSPTTIVVKSDAELTADCLAEKRSVEAALEAFHATNGTYPTDIRALVPKFLPQVPPNSIIQRDDGIVVMINACE